MKEVEMMMYEESLDIKLPCPKCFKEVYGIYILSIWWDTGLCAECCYKFADKYGWKIIGDQRNAMDAGKES